MNIIKIDSDENGSRPSIREVSYMQPPEGYAVISYDCDTAAFRKYNGYVFLETDDAGAVVGMTPNLEAWEAWKASLPDEPDEPGYISDSEALAILFGEVEA